MAGAAGAVGALAACSPSDSSEEGDERDLPTAAVRRVPPAAPDRHHQPRPAAGLAAALRVVNADRNDLIEALQKPTAEARRLQQGTPYEFGATSPSRRLRAGTLGEPPPATDLSIILSVGGVALRRPLQPGRGQPGDFVQMPSIANDQLRPKLSHGDVLLNISVDAPDASLFALRQLLRQVRSTMILE